MFGFFKQILPGTQKMFPKLKSCSFIWEENQATSVFWLPCLAKLAFCPVCHNRHHGSIIYNTLLGALESIKAALFFRFVVPFERSDLLLGDLGSTGNQ